MSKTSGDAINKYVGHRIRIRRQSLGYKLDDIATKTGISVQMCSKYERGTVQMSPHHLLIMSLVLAMPIDLLFPENPSSLSPSVQTRPDSIPRSTIALDLETDLYFRKETVDLVEAFHRLPTSELRRIVCAMVRTVAFELPRSKALLGAE